MISNKHGFFRRGSSVFRVNLPLIHEALAAHTRAYHAVHHHRVHTHLDPDYRASYPQGDQEEEIAAYHSLQAGIPCDTLYRPAGQQQRRTQVAAAPTPRLEEPQGFRFEEAEGIPKVCAHRREGSSHQVGNLL